MPRLAEAGLGLAASAPRTFPCVRRPARRPAAADGRSALRPLRRALALLAVLVLPAAVAASRDAPVTAGEDRWPAFRGDAHQTGVARGSLAESPEPLWRFQAGDAFEATAAIAGDTVYAASLDGFLYALALEDASLRWKTGVGAEIKSSPLVLEGTVYFGDEAGVLHALDAASGEERWSFQADSSVTSAPNFAGGCLLFGSYDNHIYCLEPGDGALRWKVETDSYVHATPAAAGGRAVSAGCDGYLRLVGLEDGRQLGRVPLGGYVAASAAVRSGTAYMGTFQNEVVAVDLERQEVAWRYLPDRKFAFYSSAAVDEDLVVVGGRDKRVHALDPRSGEPLWVHDAGSRVDASPVLLGERVFVATQAGDVLALDRESGEVRWRFETGSAFTASPAIAAQRLVIGSLDGDLYCFG